MNLSSRTILWCLVLLVVTSCTLFESTDSGKDKDLEETRIALAIQQTHIAQSLADPDGTPTLAPAGPSALELTAAALAATQTSMSIAPQPATPDLAATQVALSVQQTLGAGGTPTTLALPGIAPSDTPPTYQAGPGIAPSETPPPFAPPPPWGLAYISDDFSNPNTGWPVVNYNSHQTWYANGHYNISVSQIVFEAYATVGGSYTDTWMQTRAIITQDEVGASIGIACRVVDSNNFYFLQITNSSTYMVSKYWNGVLSLINMGAPKTSSAIRPYDYNLIEVSCIQNELSLTVNGVHLITAYDNTFPTGDIGLVAGSADHLPISAAFDFFIAGQ